MAESCAELEALAASREDLFALALILRGHGLEASPAQLVDAHNLLLGLRLAGALPERRSAWAPYLAPIFCRSAAEQALFHRVYLEWAPPEPEPAKEPAEPVGTMEPEASLRRPWLLPGLFALLAFWLGVVAMLPPVEPPIPPASSGAASPLPPLPPPPPLKTGREAVGRATEVLPTRPPEAVPPRTEFGWTAEELRYAAGALPFPVWLLWALWRLLGRRLVLTREPGAPPDGPHTRWVRGTQTPLFDPAELREAAGRFREPVRLPSRRLHLARTVTATVRRAGFYTPVHRGRRRPPEYLVLIDRASPPVRGQGAAPPATISRPMEPP